MTASLTGISSMATRQLLAEVADLWRHSGRGEVVFESVGGVDAARRVQDGEVFDIVVLASDAIDRLDAAGRIEAGSKTDLMRSGVAIAVRRGAPRPAVGSERELQAAVASARGIGYSTGPSGTALLRLFDRWSLAQDVRERLVQAPPGVPVGELVARGEVELGFQQLSELMHLDGIDVLGPMPPGAEIVTTFSGAVCAASGEPAAARSLLDYIRSPAVEAIRHRHGMLTA